MVYFLQSFPFADAKTAANMRAITILQIVTHNVVLLSNTIQQTTGLNHHVGAIEQICFFGHSQILGGVSQELEMIEKSDGMPLPR